MHRAILEIISDHDMSTLNSQPENRNGERKWKSEQFADVRHNKTDRDIIRDSTKLAFDTDDSNDSERKDSGIVMESGKLDQNSNNITQQDLEKIRREQSHRPETKRGSGVYAFQKASSLEIEEVSYFHTNKACTTPKQTDSRKVTKCLNDVGKSASCGITDGSRRHEKSAENLYKRHDGYQLNMLSDSEDFRPIRRGSCPITASVSSNSSPRTRDDGYSQKTKKLGCPFSSATTSCESLGGSNQSENSSVQDFFGLAGFQESPLNRSVEGMNNRGLKRGSSFRARRRYNTISDGDDSFTKTKATSQNKHFLKRIPKIDQPLSLIHI